MATDLSRAVLFRDRAFYVFYGLALLLLFTCACGPGQMWLAWAAVAVVALVHILLSHGARPRLYILVLVLIFLFWTLMSLADHDLGKIRSRERQKSIGARERDERPHNATTRSEGAQPRNVP